MVLADLDLGCWRDDRPNKLRQSVPVPQKVDAGKAADSGLVLLDADHDAAAVSVGEGGHGLEHGPLGLGCVLGSWLLNSTCCLRPATGGPGSPPQGHKGARFPHLPVRVRLAHTPR